MTKKLTTEIIEVLFVKPGEALPTDEVLDGAEKEQYRKHYLGNIDRITREFEEYKRMSPTAERTVCVRRTVKYEPPAHTEETKKP